MYAGSVIGHADLVPWREGFGVVGIQLSIITCAHDHIQGYNSRRKSCSWYCWLHGWFTITSSTQDHIEHSNMAKELFDF
jgi:hypothetical protein